MENWGTSLLQFKAVLWAVVDILSEFGRMARPVARTLGLVMLGGGLGAASRYGVGLAAARIGGTGFPWGTLTVNLTGCFLIGLFFGLMERVRFLTPEVRLFFVTGYLGALTTFSSFALETVNAGRAGMALQPLVNALVNNIGGLSLVLAGMWVGGLVE